jgi:hypothetical protein
MTESESLADSSDDAILPVALVESSESVNEPPTNWDIEAHTDEYVNDPDTTVTNDDGDDGGAVD